MAPPHSACCLPCAHVLGRELDTPPPPGEPTDLEKAEGHLPELLNRGAPSGLVKQHQFPPGGALAGKFSTTEPPGKPKPEKLGTGKVTQPILLNK